MNTTHNVSLCYSLTPPDHIRLAHIEMNSSDEFLNRDHVEKYKIRSAGTVSWANVSQAQTMHAGTQALS